MALAADSASACSWRRNDAERAVNESRILAPSVPASWTVVASSTSSGTRSSRPRASRASQGAAPLSRAVRRVRPIRWAAQRMGRTLLTARDSGAAPWEALEALGRELLVPELVELATTVQLAGTEGARIRDSLTARAASLRRHEQADAESAANAMTERLFLPGALLLLGFLVFIGYPAFQRILGGF